MARVTLATLRERIAELEAENEDLRAQLDAPIQVQYVRELHPPRPISRPIDFGAIAWDSSHILSHYDEHADMGDDAGTNVWSFHGYL